VGSIASPNQSRRRFHRSEHLYMKYDVVYIYKPSYYNYTFIIVSSSHLYFYIVIIEIGLCNTSRRIIIVIMIIIIIIFFNYVYCSMTQYRNYCSVQCSCQFINQRRRLSEKKNRSTLIYIIYINTSKRPYFVASSRIIYIIQYLRLSLFIHYFP